MVPGSVLMEGNRLSVLFHGQILRGGGGGAGDPNPL